MKITVWLMTRERTVWVAAAEALALASLILTAPESTVARLAGLALLTHLAYRALTGLPMGAIPGRPEGSRKERVNQDLRTRVVGFLSEVRSIEAYTHRAQLAGRPDGEVKANVRAAQRRMMAAAAEVAKATGRFGVV